MPEPLVVIPTYNERDNLASIVARVRQAVPAASVLVVDDASPDGTGLLADELAAADASVHVLHRAGKDGLGAAYLEAFDWALANGYDPVVQMDADGSHRPEELPDLLAALHGPAGDVAAAEEGAGEASADLVIGSRRVPGGSIVNWPKHREWLSRGGSAYSRSMLRLPYRDVTAGYRAFSADGLRRMQLEEVHTRGYGFQVDMLMRAHRAGLRIVEVPVTFVERERGDSKMSLGIVLEAMGRVTAWGIASWFGGGRRRGSAGDPGARE
ncbi:polyprenol monophosphomannose synthase [Agromyces sp. MMS24-JH15]|uniref:polyprenol monophosphomannose synthase n=1 Tax=Agromyces sp. MMS24-JH15 TaxID=3243765 RepID=UPI003747C307